VRNRLGAADALPPDTDLKAQMNHSLVRDWCKGIIASNRLIEYAAGAAGQGAVGVGRLGKQTNPRHAHRHLVSTLGYPEKAPEVDWIEVPGPDGIWKSLPILCPIKVFESLVANPNKFNNTIRGDPGDIHSFWDNLRGHPTCPADADDCSVAAGAHGDGAPTTKADGLFSFSWGSLHGKGPTRETHLLYFVIKKSEMSEGILPVLFDRFAWAMNALDAGKLPYRDWKGRPLQDGGRVIGGGWKVKLIQLRGDWEFYCQALGFPSATSEPKMCWIFDATGREAQDLRWTQYGPDAPWQATVKNHEAYIEDLVATGRPIPALFKVHTMRLEGVMIDVLHAIDQGLAIHIAGNVLFEIAETLAGTTRSARTKALDHILKAWYKGNKIEHRIEGKITPERVKVSDDWPKFKAKAAPVRAMAPFLLKLSIDNNSGSTHDLRRVGVCQLLCRFYDILKDEDLFLADHAKRELAELAPLLLRMYHLLSAEALDNGLRLWKLTPKFHMFEHMCELQTFLNPRRTWTYSDEDFQRILKEVCLSCHPSTAASMVLFKWLYLFYEVEW
jgi:hypothetical protein